MKRRGLYSLAMFCFLVIPIYCRSENTRKSLPKTSMQKKQKSLGTKSRPPVKHTQVKSTRPWKLMPMGLVVDMHADIEKEELLIRTLSFSGKCFPRTFYIHVPETCYPNITDSSPNMPMLVSLKRLRISDGKVLNDPVPARWVKYTKKAESTIQHFTELGFVELLTNQREIVFHRQGKVYRWKAPFGSGN